MPKERAKERREKARSELPSNVAMANEEDPGDSNVENPPPMEALKNMQDAILETINTRFDQLNERFASLQSSHNTLSVRMDSLDERAVDYETRLNAAEEAISKLQRENASLRAKTNDLEGRSRRHNIKLVGIPEGEEKGKPTEFVSGLIPKLLGETNFSKPVIIDRAHRSLQPMTAGPAARPRTIIARVHHYQEKEMIVRLARQQPIKYDGHRIFIFPDYTAEVMEQRRGFREAMATLRELKIKHSLRFPAKLHFQHNGLQKVFTSPAEATKFISNLERDAGAGQTE